MLERERHRLIQKLVDERSVIGVGDLVELLGASEATIRRDINAMAERGELKRVRGGAESLIPKLRSHLVGTPFALSREVAVAEKRAIAEAAVGLVRPGDSILINAGSTTWQMAAFLAAINVDIFTNSFAIAAALLATGSSRVTIPGGAIYREHQLILSPFAGSVLGHFWGHVMFTGCHGLNAFGMMESDPLLAQTEVAMMKRAERLVILADSRKLRQRTPMIVASPEQIALVITDDGATDAELEALRDAGMETRVVAVSAREGVDNVA